ncbi:UNVERIFIED_CONTAM: retron Eco8 family effector endonuclease [Halobacillus marinus]
MKKGLTIKGIEIKNVKSIKNTYISLTDINCLIGENGAGKSNILKAIKYFYDNLDDENYSKDLFDKSNPYNYGFEITFYYDFSKLINIKNHNEFKHLDKGINSTFKLISTIENFLDNENTLAVTLTQHKNDLPKWDKTPFNIRVFLKNHFPFYFVQARHIDLHDWEYIWKAIGELSRGKKTDKDLQSELEVFFGDFYKNYSRFKKDIEHVLKNSNIDIKNFKPSELFAHIHQLQLGGNKFQFQDKTLEFFSDGLNSYSYLTLLIMLVRKLSISTLKEPTIIIDEPEIGLHPQKIDELTNILNGNNGKSKQSLNYIIATHSTRLIRNVVNSPLSSNIYNMKMTGNYSRLTKLNDFIDRSEKLLLSEKEASYYFSDKILFVEGQTELELFQHPYLIELFPVLKKIDVFSFDSNNVKLKTILPSEKNTGIPYLLLYDLDKILAFNQSNGISIKRESNNPLGNKTIEEKEKYLYGKERIRTYERRKRIKGQRKKITTLTPDPKWLYISDEKYSTFKKMVKEYCLEYNVFVVDTTIEGTIINSQSIHLIIDWLTLEAKLDSNELVMLINMLTSNSKLRVKTTVLRLLFKGKYETLQNLDDAHYNKVLNDASNFSSSKERDNFKAIYKLVKNSGIKKTNGWVSDFLYYLQTKRKDFKNNKAYFKKYFPELYKTIEVLEQKVL